jgi:hypothetical protein
MFLTAIPGALTDISTNAKVTPGSRYVDEAGKQYIYALGIGSTVAGSFVAFSLETTGNTPITALLTEAIGVKGCSIGVALSANVASSYGWYQVYGACEGSVAASDAADAVQHCTTSGGVIDDAGTTHIHGIRLVDTVTTAANATVFLTHPHTGI